MNISLLQHQFVLTHTIHQAEIHPLVYSWVTNTYLLNLLKPNVNYSGRTAPLTSKVAFYIFIQQI